jgi:hypothetical protein
MAQRSKKVNDEKQFFGALFVSEKPTKNEGLTSAVEELQNVSG